VSVSAGASFRAAPKLSTYKRQGTPSPANFESPGRCFVKHCDWQHSIRRVPVPPAPPFLVRVLRTAPRRNVTADWARDGV